MFYMKFKKSTLLPLYLILLFLSLYSYHLGYSDLSNDFVNMALITYIGYRIESAIRDGK